MAIVRDVLDAIMHRRSTSKPDSDLFSTFTPYAQTPAEIAAGVTPTNYAYGTDHIGADIRRYGNIDLTGATDCQPILTQAASLGVALYFPKGLYRLSTNQTFNITLIFEQGAILKPDANVTITINANLMAGPWQIFNTSNSGAIVTGLIRVPYMYAEWWGAVGNGSTDDSAPIQATLKAAADAGYIPVQLLAKTYKVTTTIYGGGSNAQRFFAPPLYGIPGYVTTIDGSAIAAGAHPILTYIGGSGGLNPAQVRDIVFNGNTSIIGLEFSGANGMRAVRCRFSNLNVGINFHNDLTGSFTEYCVGDHCDFQSTVNWCCQYIITSGNTSFHGSGLTNRCTIVRASGGVFLIQLNAIPYNAPCDIQCWTTPSATATTIFQNGGNGSSTFHGTITVEVQSGTMTLGQGVNNTQFAGRILSLSEHVVGGSLIQCDAAAINSNGSVTALGFRRAYQANMATGANILTSALGAGGARLVYAVFKFSTTYEIRMCVLVDHSGTGGAGISAVITTFTLNNAAGFGAPTFTVDTSGNPVATNAAWPASGVVCNWSEMFFGPGAPGSFYEQI